MIYTRQGDQGQTSIPGSKKKILKNSLLIKALGEVDELNSLIGLSKVKAKKQKNIYQILAKIQNDLFIIQAEISGYKKKIKKQRIQEIEKIINQIEKKLPRIKGFIISGGTELSALLDYIRTVTRRVERQMVALKKKNKISPESFQYLNRLSSLFFVLARLVNKNQKIKEKTPKY